MVRGEAHLIVWSQETECENGDQLRRKCKTYGMGREEDGRHTEMAAIVTTWNPTAPGERDLWSEFLRMMSGRSDMVVRRKGKN